METQITNIIVNNFYNRFNQAKELGEVIKKKTEKVKSIVEEIKTQTADNPSKTAKDFKAKIGEFKKEEISSTLLQQQVQSLLTRALEYYKVIQLTNTPIDISEEDKKFLEKSTGSIDLYGVDKGDIVILDSNYHQAVMDSIQNIPDDTLTKIYNFIIAQ